MKTRILLQIALIGAATHLSALALPITPSSGVLNTSRWQGNETGESGIQTAIASYLGTSTELYKQDHELPLPLPAPEGTLASSYSTVFLNTPEDPQEATITYIGGLFVGPTAFLLVKDGNQEPAWYLFNLTTLGWNGTETLLLTDFWPNQGAISHVSLFGTQQQPGPGPTVPDGGTTSVLLGVALLILASLRPRTRQL